MLNHQRGQEISRLLKLSGEEVVRKAGSRLLVFDDCDGIHRRFADDIADLIKERNEKGQRASFILPVGPVGQYSILLSRIHQERISLKDCWFFFMDEYADEEGHAVGTDHPLSFQKQMRELWLDDVEPELAIPEDQLFFPSERNISFLAERIEEVGGIDMCLGGVGIHGHVAFNEPESGVRDTDPRLVRLNDFTVTINAVRSKVGGNLEGFPKKAFTLGMRQILGARQLRLACRNGIDLDWANTILRLTLFGSPGDDYPCTHVNAHPDFIIHTDRSTLRQPEILL